MVKGTLRADGIALMEISHISFLAGAANPKMVAKLAFVKSDTGATLGWTEHANWSKETLAHLASLRASMEEDVADLYMQGSEGASSHPHTDHLPMGIAAHIGSDETPSY